MNKYQFHFGDYYNDGHGRYITVHCQSPKNKEEIQEISKRVLETYPQLDDWRIGGLCINYEESNPDWRVLECMIAVNFPFQRLIEACDFGDDQFTSWEDAYDNGDIFFTEEFVAEIWIWFMNAFGAELEVIEDDAVHFSYHFGYGCFD